MSGAATKRCPRCGESKPMSEFNRDRSTASGKSCYCRPCDYARHKDLLGSAYYRRYRKAWELEHRYGLTLDQFHEMIRQQEGKCAICRWEANPLVVDHDHATGRVRALLCHKCNRLLGFLGNDPGILQDAVNYLLAHREAE